MKINVIGDHHYYKKGINDVSEERAQYFFNIGMAVPINEEKIIEQKTEKKIIEPVIEKKTIGRPPSKKDETDIEVKKTRKKRS